jgi:putative Mg2+ transporter-C (MgtC) family protein
MILMPEDVLKLLLAILAGGLVGAEREFRDKAAGFRTIIFICLGATLFTMLSLKIGEGIEPVRIAASVVTGVGFLGAGAILRESRRIMGLTTASTIWLAAALGMAIGAGYYLLAGCAVLAALVVLWIFPRLEAWIDNVRHTITYDIECSLDPLDFDKLERLFAESGLHLVEVKREKSDGCMRCTMIAYGKPEHHDRLVGKLFEASHVTAFRT